LLLGLYSRSGLALAPLPLIQTCGPGHRPFCGVGV